MIELISHNWLVFAIALLIGLITGWWVWARRDVTADHDYDDEQRSADTDWLPDDQPMDRDTAPAATAAAGATAAASHGAPLRAEPEPRPEPPVTEEPVIAPPVKDPAPAAAPVPKGKPQIAAAVGEPDNLRQIKGVGPKLNILLNDLGIIRFDQIAAWGPSDIAEVDGYLGNFKGRIERDNWVDQADYLAKGDIKGFEAKYGAL